ncbi:hypothetical protein INN71_13340 [Nocardioides sp. ChNu-153]|uniref:DUF6318 family protein n=1 Tax=unclassified Nocardioides TaxID=2615069 RepID=UPI002406E5BA|nr:MULTISPECIES: DUF6318 family protein [unclassified Nocardioides]MDF9715104.1 hypothetical protein [Nocardioides sp. ChNu-99]MDN7122374.1 hypothetical protein [Nocardioides sp. ChNu-153]
MRLRRRLIACTLAGTTALTACTSSSGETDDADPSGGASSSSSAPVESTSTAPTPPPLPDEATGDDDAAAIAFVEHWVELVNYSFQTGDTVPARALSTGCEACAAALDHIESTFGEGPPGRWQIANPDALAPQGDDAPRTDIVIVTDIEVFDGPEASATVTRSGIFTFGLASVDETSWNVAWADGQES